MKKITTIACFIILLSMLLTSCTHSELRLYEVYFCNDTNTNGFDTAKPIIPYNEAEQTYSLPRRESSINKTESAKKILLGADEIQLEYNSTYNKEYCEYEINSYSNNEYNIKANYRKDNGALDYIRLGNYSYRISDTAILNESTLIETCNNYVLTHVKDVSKYTIQIKTKTQQKDSNGLRNQSYEGFFSPPENNTNINVTYQVDYILYIDDIQTAEKISITIDSNGFLKTASFNMINAFDKYLNLDIDIARCEDLIKTEIEKTCDVDGYNYVGYSENQTLITIEDKLCLLSLIYPQFENVESYSSGSFEILIPVAE